MSAVARAAGVVHGLLDAGLHDIRVRLIRGGTEVLVEVADVAVEHTPDGGWVVSCDSPPMAQSCSDMREAVEVARDMQGEVVL